MIKSLQSLREKNEHFLDNADDMRWMRHVLQLAKKAEALGEVPVGAALVLNNELVGEGFNQSRRLLDPTAHAEVLALRQAAQHLHNYRLVGTTLYVTLEPCAMCAGAMVHARIERLVFATCDSKTGAAGSLFNIAQDRRLNHLIKCEHGILADEASQLLQNFFQQRR